MRSGALARHEDDPGPERPDPGTQFGGAADALLSAAVAVAAWPAGTASPDDIKGLMVLLADAGTLAAEARSAAEAYTGQKACGDALYRAGMAAGRQAERAEREAARVLRKPRRPRRRSPLMQLVPPSA